MAKLGSEATAPWNMKLLHMIDPALRLTSTADIAAAFLANNKLGVDQVEELVINIGASLGAVAAGLGQPLAQLAERPSAAAVRKSIGAGTLISFEDGKAYRMLKRHLASRGLTPQAYRAKWGLPSDYPMVAPSYSQARSQIARRTGLGHRGGRPVGVAGAEAPASSTRPRERPPKSTAPEAGRAKPPRAKPGATKGRTVATASVSHAKKRPAKAKPTRPKPGG